MTLLVRSLALAAAFALLPSCSPKWPSNYFPAGLEVKRTLFAGGGGGFRESCDAMVVEITDAAARRTFPPHRSKNGFEVELPAGWKSTPIASGDKGRFYTGAFGGCDDSGGEPLGDLPGSLMRPGAFYRVINHGEGIAIIVPQSKLAGFYYFG
ncbi:MULTISPECIES: hypothetical protein [unclassified Sphingomonas]|uniref:hypothetical protein n=1 Tax=unclassified Sphingomonas TaxID=196159 RepID=UPI000FEF78B3|nr:MULTISPECIES: hypothetical protein [unclassified Sphingomonas]RKE54232.1 hypothetical protein C8J39_0124 [Sphingomonas sp. PP-CC-1A-547]TCM00050.1 hypothetical protein C8J41_1261 [Sphingomonas sp. PP-CC-3G-468]